MFLILLRNLVPEFDLSVLLFWEIFDFQDLWTYRKTKATLVMILWKIDDVFY